MKRKILIVDDEPNIVMSLEYAFKKQNFEVFIARDGSEVFEILKGEIPDAIILDVMMPNVDGYQTIKKIKETLNLTATKVVFLSAKNKASDIQIKVAPGGNTAVVGSFIENRSRSPEGDINEEKGYETEVWQKIDGEWKIISLHYSVIADE